MKVIVRVTIGDLMLRNSEIDLLEVTQEIGQHTTCRIEFTRDSATDVTLDQLLRDPVSVKVQGDGLQIVELFQGFIGDGAQSHLLHAGSRFVLQATSPSERLEFVTTRYFPQETLASIAGTMNVKIVGTPRRDHAAFDYVQWNESEFAFLRRIADEHGGFFVTHGAEPEIRTDFADNKLELHWGDDLLEVSAHARPANNGLTGASYDIKEKSTHAHAGIRQAPTNLGGAAKLVSMAAEFADEASGGGDPVVQEPTGREATHAEFKTALRRESERALGGSIRIQGSSINTRVTAGDLVTLVSGTFFVLPTVGKLGVTKVVHTFTEQHYSNNFIATPWKGFTSFEAFESPKIDGPVTAEVVETVPDPDGQGRVRLRYRWQREDSKTNFARVAMPHTGNGRGMMFFPEVGDEVLVAFEGGDPERPIIIGSLWNGRDKPPGMMEKNQAKRIITRSGNSIQFFDIDGEEAIELFTPEGKAFIQLLNDNGKAVVRIISDGDIQLQAKDEITLLSRTIQVKADSDINISAGGNATFDAGNAATVNAGGDAVLNGFNAAVKGKLNIDAVAGAMHNIVGAMVNIQPPGFVPKPVMVKKAQVQEVNHGKRQVPEEALPQRTADAETPRG